MKQVLIEFDDETLARLERVIPSRSRRRSQFIRSAVNRALWELEEQATAEAYRRLPDASADAYQDATVWEPARGTRRGKRRQS
jgi:predicted transcriptional regulator